MKKVTLGIIIFVILLGLFFVAHQSDVTGRVAGDADASRYQQLQDCQNQGRSLTECRKASAITPEQYEALK